MFEIALRRGMGSLLELKKVFVNLLRVKLCGQLTIVQRECSYMASIIVKSTRRSPQYRDTALKAINEFFKTCYISAGTMKERVYRLIINVSFFVMVCIIC